jgi:hypothetical protein
MADPNTPAEWLARAAEATGIAERMHDALPRKTMLEIAAGYERLARYAGSAPVRVEPDASSSSVFMLPKKLSMGALSQQSALRLIEQHMPWPASRRR